MTLRFAAVLAAAVVLMIVAGQAVLVVTAGAFLAIFLNAMTIGLMGRTGLGRGVSLSLVLTGLLLLLTWFALQIGPEVTVQFNELGTLTRATVEDIQAAMVEAGWTERMEADLDGTLQSVFAEAFNIFGHITGVASTTAQVVGAIIVIAFIGLYGAAEPETYRRGVVLLFPIERRERIDEVMRLVGRTLGRWLFARALSMLLAGGLTWVGLVMLDIPLALTLSVIATFLTFIPYLGPIIAGIPAVIVGIGEGWIDAAYVIALYALVQTLEGYIITPLLLRRTIAMPPAVTLAAQIVMGVIFGFMGIALAMPLSVVGLVLVQKLYIEDVLGDDRYENDTPRYDPLGMSPEKQEPASPSFRSHAANRPTGEGVRGGQAAASRIDN